MEEKRDLWWPSPTVELAKVVRLSRGLPFRTILGAELAEIQVSYETWGELSAEKDNAVLVIHPMTADCHVTGDYAGQAYGWWEQLVGPGRAIDTERSFVICPNHLGGCYGTTGPRFDDPTGQPFLGEFPLLAPLDMMRLQRLFLEQIGVEHLRMVIGPSMGGMVAWEWAIEGGDFVDLVAVVAAPLRTTPYEIGLNWLQRRGIELDIEGDEVTARWGQMVARGIGMLSYRSPVGMEEKFGRDWFKRPGKVLKDRGVFNIESWLRHHGKKITKRFDPYTWILYSRAMDLHDVSENRDGMLAALNRVQCRTLVVGISSDCLYPASEVHVGADILSHLGKEVEYAEIRSPHGHDAFMLELDQLTTILRAARTTGAKVVPTSAERDLRLVRIGILGAGKVTVEFTKLLEERREQLLEEHQLRVEIVEIAEIDPSKRVDEALRKYPLTHDPERLVARGDLDVVVELTRGTNVYPLVERTLANRRSVLTPNKALIRDYGPKLEEWAYEHGVRIAYHNSVAAGWPVLYAVRRPLARDQVSSIQAVLSSSCNIMLEIMEAGASFEEALEHARAKGVLEDDPQLDVSAWDSAQKLSIVIARSREKRFLVEDFDFHGIEDLDPRLVQAAPALGLRVKLVAFFLCQDGSPVATVRPMAVPAEGHLGAVRGENNVVVLDGGVAGETVHIGVGSGPLPVATALFRDLVGLVNPSMSWTGRFPRATEAPISPSFVHVLEWDDGRAVVRDEWREGGIPLLDSVVHHR